MLVDHICWEFHLGRERLVTTIGIPTALIFAIQAIILIFILAARVLTRYRIRRVSDAG